jgi:hypothetical protein
LTTTGDLYACESQTNFDTIINRQQYDSSETTLTTHHDTNNNNIYDNCETINTHNKA